MLNKVTSRKAEKTEWPSDSCRNDFTVDKTTKTVSITRAFAADLSLVWDAYTKPEILDQWWAPKPWAQKENL